MAAKKRSEPGSDKEKSNEVTLSPAEVEKLEEVQKEFSRAELLLERHAIKQLKPLYEKRRSVLKSIPKFWYQALMNCDEFAIHAQHEDDVSALSYIEDLWVERDAAEPRCFTIEMHFKENPYFNDTVIKKAYKYTPPKADGDDKPDADGITKLALDFDWKDHVTPQATQISWKDDAHNLVKKHPWVQPEGEDLPEETGTIFNLFERTEDVFDLGLVLGTEVFPDAVAFFSGEDDDITDSEDEDEDDGAEEIDLEQPKKKKVKA
ncbi:hypothetical protein AURDEDRAFT_109595 [Auricularia subglabra TFB-10046 SS5]|nr:hypothetical protein AURDEDRAFT_109595 [Auricularia subglabra TFB-10046 SS5]